MPSALSRATAIIEAFANGPVDAVKVKTIALKYGRSKGQSVGVSDEERALFFISDLRRDVVSSIKSIARAAVAQASAKESDKTVDKELGFPEG